MNIYKKLQSQDSLIASLLEEKCALLEENETLRIGSQLSQSEHFQGFEMAKQLMAECEDAKQEYEACIFEAQKSKQQYDLLISELLDAKKNYAKEIKHLIKNIKE